MNQREITSLPPDLYSRNHIIAQLASIITQQETMKVLDVGGYGAELHRFFPENTDFTLLDLKEAPADIESSNIKYIRSNAQKIPFSDKNFDVVVCTDVLEHIDKPFRAPVIRELARVAKKLVILGVPADNGSGLILSAEKYVRDQFIRNAGIDHPFLMEHAEYGLPDEDKVEGVLIKEVLSYIKIREGNLMNWFIQQLYGGSFQGISAEMSEYEGTFNKFFNEHLFELGNLRAPTYRTFYCISKEANINEQEIYEELLSKHKWKPEVFMELLDKAFMDLREIINQRTVTLRESQQRLENELSELEDLKQKVAVAESAREHLSTQIQTKNVHILEQNEKIEKARKSLDKYRELALELRNYLAEKEQALNLMKEILQQKDNALESSQQENKTLTNKVEAQSKFMHLLAEEAQKKTKEIEYLKEYIKQNEKLLQQRKDELNHRTSELHAVNQDLENHKKALREVVNSRAWRTVMFYSALKMNLIVNPAKSVKKGWGILFNLGPRVFMQRLIRKIKKQTLYKPPESPYEQYILENNPTNQKRKAAEKAIRMFEYKPVISIIMPVFNVDLELLKKAVNSVQKQWYKKWELCIADDASTDPKIKEMLETFSQSDSRIKVVYRHGNGGIVKASNDALKLADGAYVGFLDNDDELTEDALYEVVKALQEEKYDLLYSDEDKLDKAADGTYHRCEPHFKPDWAPDLLLSNNYICHFSVYKKKIVNELGGMREGFDGSQDHDLVLRFTEKTQRIKHIPKILYHWRKVEGSTAVAVANKPYAMEAGKKALTQAMKRRGIIGTVEDGIWDGSYRVRRELGSRPLVSIIIPFKDRVDMLKPCLDSLLNKTTYDRYELILINNQSELFETGEFIKELETGEYKEKITIYDYNEPFNFSAINNYAANKAHGEILVLLNNDTEIINGDWLEVMLEQAMRPEVGAVGAKLLYKNDLVQHAGILVGIGGIANCAFMKQWRDDNGYFGQANVIRNYSAVTGACLMVRKEVYQSVGGLNEKELAVTFNDVDFCLRLREKGYLIVYTPYALLYHYESVSRGYNVDIKEVGYMQRKHAGLLKKGDPYYNPNLSQERSDFSLKTEDYLKG